MPRVTHLLDHASSYIPTPFRPIFSPVFPIGAEVRDFVYEKSPDIPRTTPWGVKLYVDHDKYVERSLANGSFETEFIRYFLDQATDVDHFADVGANVGFFSFLCALQTDCRVDAFEPNPHNAVRLTDNSQLNGVDVNLHTFAIGDSTTVVPLHVSDDHPGESTISAELNTGAVTRTVQCAMRRLDDVYKDDDSPDCLKIDVEGAEDSVLRGGTELLSTTPDIFLELHPGQLSPERQKEIVALLRETGYSSCYHVEGSQYKSLSSLETFEDSHTHFHLTG